MQDLVAVIVPIVVADAIPLPPVAAPSPDGIVLVAMAAAIAPITAMPKFVVVVVKSETNEFLFATGLGITMHGCEGDGSNGKSC